MTALRAVLPRYECEAGSVDARVRLHLGQHRPRRGRRSVSCSSTQPSRPGATSGRRPVEELLGRTQRFRRPPAAAQAAPASTVTRSAASCSATRSGAVPPKPVARRERALDGEHRADVRGQVRRDVGQVYVAHLVQVQSFTWHQTTRWPTISCASRNGTPRCTRYSARSVASVNPAGASSRSRCGVDPQGGDQPGHRGQHQEQGVDGVEDRLLVLLQVPVVGQRKALERGEQAGQVADRAGRPCPGRARRRPGSSSAA